MSARRKARNITVATTLNLGFKGYHQTRQNGGRLFSRQVTMLESKQAIESLTQPIPVHDAPRKNDLRKILRARRRALSARHQKQASIGLCRQLARLPAFIRAHRLAVYIANDGEIDLQPLIELAWRLNKLVCLPVLHPFRHGHLLFMPYHPYQALAYNRFGIPEPLCDHSDLCPVWTLDLVFTPLVGFDSVGNRMGMGGGFYDRTFSFIDKRTKPHDPILVGVAHECQKVETIPSEHWDISMRFIATETSTYRA